MYTYSLTLSLEPEIEQQWLDYIKAEHIPALKACGYFDEISVFQIVEPGPEPEDKSVTYNIQCVAGTMEHLRLYMKQEAPRIHGKHDKTFEKKFHAMDALLKNV